MAMDYRRDASEAKWNFYEADDDWEDRWEDHEDGAVHEMAMLGLRIRRQDNQPDLSSREGRDAAHKLLRCVENVGEMLQLQLAPRTYRRSILGNVLTAWTQHGSRYSVRILAVSVQHRRDIVVKNQVFTLSPKAALLSLQLCRKWDDLGNLLKYFLRQGPEGTPKRSAMGVLEAFDRAWAAFEHIFFSEVEVMYLDAQHPLAPMVRATERVCNLQRIYDRFYLEAQVQMMVDDPEYQEQRRLLVETFSRLNRTANPENKGRNFTVTTLNELEAVIEQCEMDQPDLLERAHCPSFRLAADAVEAFNSLCAYFCQVKNRMNCVDPELHNNSGLVERISRWEVGWIRAADHVLDPFGRQALEALMASVRKAQILSPELAEMCEECSADIFLALPRLVWLSFLEAPVDMTPRLQYFLPHHFMETRSADGELGCCPGDGLWKMLEEHGRVLDCIAPAVPAEALEDPQVQARALDVGFEEARRELAARVLSRRAVLGSRIDMERYSDILVGGPEGLHAREACDEFMRNLEGWSVELQRHCAPCWNAFVATLVRCLSADPRQGGGDEEPFRV